MPRAAPGYSVRPGGNPWQEPCLRAPAHLNSNSSSTSSIVAQRFCGQQARRARPGIYRGEARENECETANPHHVRCTNPGRQVAHEIRACVQELESDDAFESVHE